MAVRLTPPTKNVFYLSTLIVVIAVVLYLFAVFGLIAGGFAAVAHYAFWIAIIGWGLLAIGVSMKGV